MLGLTAYMDETGHSGDTSYVGMAGLVAPSSRWVVFENDWKVDLTGDSRAKWNEREST